MTLNQHTQTNPSRSPVFSHFPGASHTPWLHRVLNNREGRRVAVTVNERSGGNFDGLFVERRGTEGSRTEGKRVEMSNGGICCTQRDDLPVTANSEAWSELGHPFRELKPVGESA